MNTEIQNYLAHIANDYCAWNTVPDDADAATVRVRTEMVSRFCAGLTIEEGRKYIKVVSGGPHRSVHSFIVKQDDGKFRAGDILKAASWATPAKNFARGNVLRGEFNAVRWTGA